MLWEGGKSGSLCRYGELGTINRPATMRRAVQHTCIYCQPDEGHKGHKAGLHPGPHYLVVSGQGSMHYWTDGTWPRCSGTGHDLHSGARPASQPANLANGFKLSHTRAFWRLEIGDWRTGDTPTNSDKLRSANPRISWRRQLCWAIHSIHCIIVLLPANVLGRVASMDDPGIDSQTTVCACTISLE